ncbi:hypothetical protein CQW23_33509 [Capsicum baccatum]|uniref:Uncharacterized protein n=1 Tax=Capsicum baccatum TaxID=33114 RepID=A0A2G2V1N2_CAPBA|nr:hypothetical protein CQW23_33509 [Capsicum baccatum]
MTGLSPSPAPPSRGLGPGPPLRTLLQTTIQTTEPPDSKAGLFPIRSPLLRESLRALGLMASGSTCVQRLEISIAEIRFHLQKKHRSPRRTPRTGREGQAIDSSSPWHFPHRGSPTETLLRLLLPLNDKVQWTSRDVAGSEPPTSPRSEHFTGSFNRQIAPPTKSGHAPPPIESRKSSQSVSPYYVWTWYAAQETDFDQAYIALAPRLRWQAGQDVAARAGIQPNHTCRTQLTPCASKCSVDARPAPAPTPGNRCRALLPMRTLQGRSKSRLTR